MNKAGSPAKKVLNVARSEVVLPNNAKKKDFNGRNSYEQPGKKGAGRGKSNAQNNNNGGPFYEDKKDELIRDLKDTIGVPFSVC